MTIKILIVDDEKTNRRTLEKFLQKLLGASNIEISHAENGFEAEDTIKKGYEPMLIFLDCDMPMQNGLITCTNIRTLGCTSTIITWSRTYEGIFPGANDEMPKPPELHDVQKICQKYGLAIQKTKSKAAIPAPEMFSDSSTSAAAAAKPQHPQPASFHLVKNPLTAGATTPISFFASKHLVLGTQSTASIPSIPLISPIKPSSVLKAAGGSIFRPLHHSRPVSQSPIHHTSVHPLPTSRTPDAHFLSRELKF